MSAIRAKISYWLVLSLLACSCSTTTCGIAEADTECVAQISRLQHRWDRKQSQLKVEKEELTKELEDCRAAEMACGTREDLCKHKLETLDRASDSPVETIQNLESKVRQHEYELESSTARAAELKQQARILELRLEGVQTKLYLEINESKSLKEDLQILQYEKDSCQESRQSLLAKLETLQEKIVEQRRQSESKQEIDRQTISNLADQYHAELEAVRLESDSSMSHFQSGIDALKQKHALEMLKVRQEVTAQMEKEMSRRKRQLLAEKQSLQIVIRQMHADLSEDGLILRTVKDDLFDVRRELFDLKEIYVRGPERRRRLRIHWWRKLYQRFLNYWRILVQAGDEALLLPILRAWDRVLASHEKYCIPVWQSLKDLLEPVCSPICAAGRKICRSCAAAFWKLYPIVLRCGEAAWRKVSKVASLVWLVLMQKSSYWWIQFVVQVRMIAIWTSHSIGFLWDHFSQHIVAWRQRASWSQISQSTSCLAHEAYLVAKGLQIELSLVAVGVKIEIRELLHRHLIQIAMVVEQTRQVMAEKYEQDFQPRLHASVKSIPVENVTLLYRQHLEPHLHALYSRFQQHLQPRLEASVEGYRRTQAATADALGIMADFAIDNTRSHQYLVVLTPYFEWVQFHSTAIVFYGELMVLLAAITVMLIRPRRHKTALLSTASASGKTQRPLSKLRR